MLGKNKIIMSLIESLGVKNEKIDKPPNTPNKIPPQINIILLGIFR
jgi:hypothetical protein